MHLHEGHSSVGGSLLFTSTGRSAHWREYLGAYAGHLTRERGFPWYVRTYFTGKPMFVRVASPSGAPGCPRNRPCGARQIS
jgi:hypothetical protein